LYFFIGIPASLQSEFSLTPAGTKNPGQVRQDAAILDTLSAAYAEAGRFPNAIEVEQQAIAVATQQGKTALTSTLQAHLTRYESHAPLREPPDPVSF
jgi:hypothetical protein